MTNVFVILILLYELLTEIVAIFKRNVKGGKLVKKYSHKTKLRYFIFGITILSVIFTIYVFISMPQYAIDGVFLIIYCILVTGKYFKDVEFYEHGIFAFGTFLEFENMGRITKIAYGSYKIEKRRSVLGVILIENISEPEDFIQRIRLKTRDLY
jgi:hypothetical protein